VSGTQVEHANRLYAELAAKYDDETRYITGIRLIAIEALALAAGETVLDAGCGTGWCLPRLSNGVGPTGAVLGFEPSPDMLCIAQSRVERMNLRNVRLHQACGASARLERPPDAILFSYTHDLLQSRDSLAHLFSQARRGTRIVAASTKLFPRWFPLGNWYLRHTHRETITNFDGFDRPWRHLPEFCASWQVRTTAPGSRYLFTGVLR
jgi:SAM-dependent methyltransferase